MASSDERSRHQSGARSTVRCHVELRAPRTREVAAKYDHGSQVPDRRPMIPISEPCTIRRLLHVLLWHCQRGTRFLVLRPAHNRRPPDADLAVLPSSGGCGWQRRGTKGWRRRRPELTSMVDDAGGSLAQNRIDVRLVESNVYFNKPVWGSDLQLLLLPADRSGPFNPEDLSSSTLHHMAIFALCLG